MPSPKCTMSNTFTCSRPHTAPRVLHFHVPLTSRGINTAVPWSHSFQKQNKELKPSPPSKPNQIKPNHLKAANTNSVGLLPPKHCMQSFYVVTFKCCSIKQCVHTAGRQIMISKLLLHA